MMAMRASWTMLVVLVVLHGVATGCLNETFRCSSDRDCALQRLRCDPVELRCVTPGIAVTQLASNVELDLAVVWGLPQGEVFAGGDGKRILHLRGDTWDSEAVADAAPNDSITTMFGTSPQDMWAGTDQGKLLRRTGTRWGAYSMQEFGRVDALHGTGPQDVWLGSLEGFFHFDGTDWTEVTGPGVFGFAKLIWAASPQDVWVYWSPSERLTRLNGTTWQDVGLPQPVVYPKGLTGCGPNDVWFSALGSGSWLAQWDGTAWRMEDTLGAVDGMHCGGAGQLWLVGDQLSMRDGATWATKDASQLRAVWGDGTRNAYAVGYEGLAVRLHAY